MKKLHYILTMASAICLCLSIPRNAFAAEDTEMTPEQCAKQTMEAFYKAVAADDFETYSQIDYEAGEMDWFTEKEWERYNKAELKWKKENPEKWKAIKEYRKKKIAEGIPLVILDMD